MQSFQVDLLKKSEILYCVATGCDAVGITFQEGGGGVWGAYSSEKLWKNEWVKMVFYLLWVCFERVHVTGFVVSMWTCVLAIKPTVGLHEYFKL